MEHSRHFVGRQELLLDVVETTRVKEPDASQVPLARGRVANQVSIEPVEEKRVADPHDAGHHVYPSQQDIEELANALFDHRSACGASARQDLEEGTRAQFVEREPGGLGFGIGYG